MTSAVAVIFMIHVAWWYVFVAVRLIIVYRSYIVT